MNLGTFRSSKVNEEIDLSYAVLSETREEETHDRIITTELER